jgi:CHAT domain-containing protein/tetratricopeptide (TPR) repeat protein
MHSYVLLGNELPFSAIDHKNPVMSYATESITDKSRETELLNDSLKILFLNMDFKRASTIVEKLTSGLNIKNIGDTIVWDSYYLIGVYHIYTRGYSEGINYLDSCIYVKEQKKEYDNRYAKALYNLGVAYSGLGDLHKFEYYALKSLEIGKSIYGESNPYLIHSYLSLSVAYTEKKEYEKAISNSNIALTLANRNREKVSASIFSDLYYALGVCYSRIGDFSEAKIYFDKTESIYKNYGLDQNDNFINLINGQALTYNSLGMTNETADYYEKGIRLAVSNNSLLAFNMINSYCVFLANNKKAEKGELLLRKALQKAKTMSELNPRNYFEVLKNYADYLRENKINIRKSIECYEQCLLYLNKNKNDINLKISVYIGYSNALEDSGKKEKALQIIQSLLFSDSRNSNISGNYDNPGLETLKPDITSLKILKLKYNILWDIYKKKPDLRILEAASNTSELIISLLDNVRINIGEEESRLILGDRYRDSYLNSIRDFNLLYNKTSDSHYLEKAFEYSEKSKVAGLLTSTRELKAAQFHIPSDIGNLERELQREISLINVHIFDELSSEKPDQILITKWKENLFKYSRKRDSLILVFEKQYPDYYAIKYNTHVVGTKDIPEIVGHNGNYINYVISDSVIYIFIVNRSHQKLLALPIDSSFFNDVRQFRSLLSIPSPSDNASLKFKEFQTVGCRLYKTLIDPIRSYLISDKIFISPDNILSYLPFETIPTSTFQGEVIRYRDISYLMNDFDISYTYSATFMAESVKKEYSRSNRLIAFAPDYPEPIDIQSVLKSRQAEMGILNDLPFARLEAKYVADITGGTLFENSEAKESVYKKEAGKYDIIHLAMHTLLNDKDPMHSTLIFSRRNDSLEDGYLNTYEIYGIPLKAKMVVLSACNTGSGLLYSGEGILSLARGFIYSGSQSVIMSMWEIEDKSGTEIVEGFYKNLKKGYTKSVALKRARIEFLKNADQLRAHPYFWSTLVVYGDNAPLYRSNKMKIMIITIGTILFLSLGFYFWKRKYS